jgi:hypothetical protein
MRAGMVAGVACPDAHPVRQFGPMEHIVGRVRVSAVTASRKVLVLVPERRAKPRSLLSAVFLFLCFVYVPVAHGSKHKERKEDFGHGFSTEVAVPQAEVIDAVQFVVNDGIIEGSKEYSKDKFIMNASPADSSALFPPWVGPGQVFYKVREAVLAPANFYESTDQGTMAVRYVVKSKDASKSILQIDAVFVEDFRHTVHPSNGSVETAEYQAIQNRVDAIELDKKQTRDAEKHRQEQLAQQSLEQKKKLEEEAELAAAEGSSDNLEQQVANLRHQVERVIKASGANLKSAPFHTATTLKQLSPGSDVVILVVTPYWYGVETEDGQHGWIHHSQLEPLP